MNEALSRSWWILALRGVIAILFGVLALAWPGITVLAFVILFATFALLSGVVSVVGALKSRRADSEWWLLLITGLVGIGTCAITLLHPGLTALILILLLGVYALITGILDISAAMRLRRTIRNEWMMLLSGATSVLFGVLIFLFPVAGGLFLVWLISLYAVITGSLFLSLAFRLRAIVRSPAGRIEQRVTPDRRISAAH